MNKKAYDTLMEQIERAAHSASPADLEHLAHAYVTLTLHEPGRAFGAFGMPAGLDSGAALRGCIGCDSGRPVTVHVNTATGMADLCRECASVAMKAGAQ